MRHSRQSIDHQISRFGGFNETIIHRELSNSIRTIWIDFGDSRFVIDVPTISRLMLQHEHTFGINLPVAFTHLLRSGAAVRRMNDSTVMIDAAAIIENIGFAAPNQLPCARQQEDEEISNLCLLMEGPSISDDNFLCMFKNCNFILFANILKSF